MQDFWPLLGASLEPLAYLVNVASLVLFYRYYFGRFSSELAQLVLFPYSRGSSTCYSDRLHYPPTVLEFSTHRMLSFGL